MFCSGNILAEYECHSRVNTMGNIYDDIKEDGFVGLGNLTQFSLLFDIVSV